MPVQTIALSNERKDEVIEKIKQQNFIGIRAFDSRLYLDISRSFK
jgi:hypothetical protein